MQLQEWQARLHSYRQAEERILRAQEYGLGTRRMRRADLAQVRAGIAECQQRIAQLQVRNRIVCLVSSK